LSRPAARGWPVTLEEGPVGLRPLRRRDRQAWVEVRGRNFEWLAPWEATPPRDGRVIAFPAMVRTLSAQARRGQMMPFVVTYEGRLVGQLTVGGITWGSLCAAHIGYWIDAAVAGRGIMPTAVALVSDHCFGPAGLHRIEINIRPENTASLRVVEKLGFRDEGLRQGFLHIDGAWRDHRAFALTAEELPPGGLIGRRRAAQSHESHSSQD
jgi:ribosomal-protein-alanine N-acetyltransferase